MARVTVEDCLTAVPNRFDLVIYCAQRARAIAAGAPTELQEENEKRPVVALREFAENKVAAEGQRRNAIQKYRRYRDFDESEEDRPQFDAVEEETMLAAHNQIAPKVSRAAPDGETLG